jgi:hypothetical protein
VVRHSKVSEQAHSDDKQFIAGLPYWRGEFYLMKIPRGWWRACKRLSTHEMAGKQRLPKFDKVNQVRGESRIA